MIVLVALAASSLLVGPAYADDGDAIAALREQLSKARYKQHTEKDHAAALRMYGEILESPAVGPQIRGDAMLGQVRCHLAMDQQAQAEVLLKDILADETIPIGIREEAEKESNALKAELVHVDDAERREMAFQELQARQREEARGLLEQARRTFEDGRLELARQLCLDAKRLIPENPEADALLARINDAMPDRGELLGQMLRFAQSTHVRAFRGLKSEIARLADEGIVAYGNGDFAAADEQFRKAILRIDASEFLPDLTAERAWVLMWLRRTLQDARKKGLDLGPEPILPDPDSVASGWRRQFYELLSRVFAASEADANDPLLIYEFLPADLPMDAPDAKLAAGAFPSGMSVTRSPGSMTRAAWAEQWIRGHVGTGWTETRTRSGMEPRVLARFGDTLIVQNNRGAQAKVRELLESFPQSVAPVAVDVAAFAATTAGGTRLAEMLGARATPREGGMDLVLTNRILEECLRIAQPGEDLVLPGLQPLGTLRVMLGGKPSTSVSITQRSEMHPVFDGLGKPSLVLTEEESRYGIDLDLFAEDLQRAEGAPRSALGVRAVTRRPSGSIVVPRPNAQGAWQRIPRPMAEQVIEAYRVVPHAGTLLVQGLGNPFPESAQTHPGLILLIAVRPTNPATGRVATPDPGRPVAPGMAPTNGIEEREYDLGPLATEVVDEVLVAGWPKRPATIPIAPAAARKARETWMSTQLGSAWARLAEPGTPSPVKVRGDVASAALTTEGHKLLEAAVQRMREADKALYEIDVVTAEVTEALQTEWLRQSAGTPFTPDTWMVAGSGARALDALMRTQASQGGLYTLQSRLLARATQKVGARNLRTLSIVGDLRLWRGQSGLRYIPVPGLAEEGIVVLVRPGLEVDGKRQVTIEANAARLSALEQIEMPNVEVAAAKVTIPQHFPRQSRNAAPRLGDDEALVLSLPAPEGAGRNVLVKVRVTKVQ